ncbi:MAG: transposase [Lachnospiraceae bacterium]
MARKARLKSASHIYHIVIRGVDRQHIFEETSDFKKYLEILEFYKEKCNFELYAYCLMSNHVHLLLKTQEVPLESIFRHINTCYATWYNMKYDRTGFLQQGRYYSEPVEDLRYLFTVIRYIHLNPYKAGLEEIPGTSYPWSSMQSYIKQAPPFLNTSFILDQIGGKERFLSFHKEIDETECLDIHQIRKRIPDDVAKEIIQNETGCASVTDFQSLSLLERNKHLVQLHKMGISIRQLNRLTGIPKGIISRNVTEGQSS